MVVVSVLLPGRADAFDEAAANEAQQEAAEQLGIDVVDANSIEMELVLIPAGDFLMGSPKSERERQRDEEPQHRVWITHEPVSKPCETLGGIRFSRNFAYRQFVPKGF